MESKALVKSTNSNVAWRFFARTPSRILQVRRTRHAGHCWRSKDKLISDVLLWTPTYGRAKAGRPARTYIQQLCEDTGWNSEDLPEAINDREKWRERVRDIRAGGTTWWWWWWLIHWNIRTHHTASSHFLNLKSQINPSFWLIKHFLWYLSIVYCSV